MFLPDYDLGDQTSSVFQIMPLSLEIGFLFFSLISYCRPLLNFSNNLVQHLVTPFDPASVNIRKMLMSKADYTWKIPSMCIFSLFVSENDKYFMPS